MKLDSIGFWRACALFALTNVAALAGGGGASITLQPVPPRTNPPSSYPPGTTIVGHEIILGSVPARVWLEVHTTGWAPHRLRSVNARIDGAGFLGENANCLDQPTPGADIVPARIQCTEPQQCRLALMGHGLVCSEIDTTHCHKGMCTYGFEDGCDPRWPDFPLILHDHGPCMSGAGLSLGLSCYYGGTMDVSDSDIPDHSPTYLGTLVVDVPATAKGTYTIPFFPDQTFLQNDAPLGQNNIPVTMFSARITAPCGRCCSGYGGDAISCTDRVAEADCTDVNDQVFSEGELCPASGGPACAACATDLDCDDGVACTKNLCNAGQACDFVPNHAFCSDGEFCNGVEMCHAANGCAPGEPPCADDLCDEANYVCLSEIPTVSNWGLVILVLALLVTAKLRYRIQRGIS